MREMAQFIAVALLVMAGTRTASGADVLAHGERIGPVAFETLEGHPVVMNNYDERKWTAVLFLSARCGFTESLIGEINDVYVKNRLRGILFIGVSSNPEESGEELRTYLQNRGIIFPIFRDVDGSVTKQFGPRVTPEIFILDHEGALVWRGGVMGSNDEPVLRDVVTGLLAGKPAPGTTVSWTGTPIGQPGHKQVIDNPYGTISFSSELIFEKIPSAVAHHCSTLAEAPNGDLLCLWYGGSYESGSDQTLFLSRRPKGERVWTEPEVLVRDPEQPPGNAVIFVDGADRVWIVWGRMEASRPLRRGAGWGECRLLYRISTDNGFTWSNDEVMPGSFSWLPRNVPIILANGELVLPVSGGASQAHDGAFFLITADNGKTWEQSAVIAGGSQPTVVERADGSLMTFLRGEPRIRSSESHDRGRTWTEATPTQLMNPGAGIAMTRLQSGELLLVYNNSATKRTPLSITTSSDDGETWSDPLDLETNPGVYSYPCAIQASDGKIHVTYTYRRYTIIHTEFNETWLTHFVRPH